MSFGPTVYQGAWNTGADYSITVVDNATNNSIAFGGRMSAHKATAKDTVLESDGMDNGGRVDHMVIPRGWTGTITVQRYNGDLMVIRKFLDANYYAGGDTRYYTITRKILNRYGGGPADEDVFTFCVLSIDEGDVAVAKGVPMTITFHAQELK